MVIVHFNAICCNKLNLLCCKKHSNGMGLRSNILICTFSFVNHYNAQFPNELDMVGNRGPWDFPIKQYGGNVMLLLT